MASETSTLRHIPCCRICPCFGSAWGRRGVGRRRGWKGWSWDSTSVKTVSIKNATTCRQDTVSLLCSCVAVLHILFTLFSYVTHLTTISTLTLKGTQSWTSVWKNMIWLKKVSAKIFLKLLSVHYFKLNYISTYLSVNSYSLLKNTHKHTHTHKIPMSVLHSVSVILLRIICESELQFIQQCVLKYTQKMCQHFSIVNIWMWCH